MGGHWTWALPRPAAGAGAAAEPVADGEVGRFACGAATGAGSVTSSSAGGTTAQGFTGVQPLLLLCTELSGGGTTATVLGAPGTCANTGPTARVTRMVRSNPVRTAMSVFLSGQQSGRGPPAFKGVRNFVAQGK